MGNVGIVSFPCGCRSSWLGPGRLAGGVGEPYDGGRVTVNGKVVTELGSKVDPLVDGGGGRRGRALGRRARHHHAAQAGRVRHHHVRSAGTAYRGRARADRTLSGAVPHRAAGLRHHGPLAVLHRRRAGQRPAASEASCDEARTWPASRVVRPSAIWRFCGAASSWTTADAAGRRALLEAGRLAMPSVCWRFRRRAAALLEGSMRPCSEGRATRRSIVRLGIREGRKRQVKRMLAAVGHPVLALHRDSFGPLELGDLPRGAWRALEQSRRSGRAPPGHRTCRIMLE